MKKICTYLVREHPYQEDSTLVSVSSGEWVEIVQKNKALPKASQRYFIREDILDGDVLDRMYIEVDFEQYVSWNKEKCYLYRLRQTEIGIQTLSLDVDCGNAEETSLHEIIASGDCVEDTVVSSLTLEAIREELVKWKPWAGDMLDLYTKYDPRHGLEYFTNMHNVQRRTYYKYKTEFEEKIIKILELLCTF